MVPPVEWMPARESEVGPRGSYSTAPTGRKGAPRGSRLTPRRRSGRIAASPSRNGGYDHEKRADIGVGLSAALVRLAWRRLLHRRGSPGQARGRNALGAVRDDSAPVVRS